MKFGEMVKEKRLSQDFSLRAFCKKFSIDPGNWSKMERGIIPPPQDEEKLLTYAKFLDIKYGSDEWYNFIDLAAAGKGIIPIDILKNSDLVNNLPLFFRTVRNKKPTKADLKKLLEVIRKNP